METVRLRSTVIRLQQRRRILNGRLRVNYLPLLERPADRSGEGDPGGMDVLPLLFNGFPCCWAGRTKCSVLVTSLVSLGLSFFVPLSQYSV